MANANWENAGKIYSPYVRPVLLTCNFVVDSTNGNGLGIRSLKGLGIRNIFMNTSPAATTATSVFASGATTITVSSLLNLVVGMVVTDSTTGGNITGGTTIASIYAPLNQITLSVPTAGASAVSPGDTLSFAMTAALAGNPNPQAGVIVVQMGGNHNRYLAGFSGFVSPTTGSPIVLSAGSGITAGHPYIIVTLGTTTTAANWVTAGLPLGYTAAVGAAFIATAAAATGTGLGNATVIAVGVSGATSIEVVGDPNQTISGQAPSGPVGSQMILQVLGATNSSTTTLIPKAPANGSVVGLSFYLSDSIVTTKGQ